MLVYPQTKKHTPTSEWALALGLHRAWAWRLSPAPPSSCCPALTPEGNRSTGGAWSPATHQKAWGPGAQLQPSLGPSACTWGLNHQWEVWESLPVSHQMREISVLSLSPSLPPTFPPPPPNRIKYDPLKILWQTTVISRVAHLIPSLITFKPLQDKCSQTVP